MCNTTKQTYPETFFCPNDVSTFVPEGYQFACIEEYFPVWPADMTEGPFTLWSYDTGELLLCPKHLTQHPPARAIGPNRTAAGIVCDECKAVYALTCILPDEHENYIGMVCNDRDELVNR
ncbi:Uncharacterised protein [Burkholderia pseudomallei]|nr:Uncharacterised protein [Burkholderia pseudomallei]CAK0114094.1 Uncharacterised protein [Burkholderia pseudomallei]